MACAPKTAEALHAAGGIALSMLLVAMCHAECNTSLSVYFRQRSFG
jgi:hypothetical protein